MNPERPSFPETAPPAAASLRILCLGDVVGRPGRQILKKLLPLLRREWSLDMIIANGENAAGGIGLTTETLKELLGAGVDVVTTGNHVWKHRELYPALDKEPRLLRPANYGQAAPGRGMGVYAVPGGSKVAVINLAGRVYMDPVDCPFAAAGRLLEEAGSERSREEAPSVPVRIVDFHAEATSEKKAMGHFLAGRVSAVLGTHTHVQTADVCVLPGGTAYLTDLGMCGVEEDSVLGMKKEPVLQRFVTGLPYPFKPASGTPSVNGALLEIEAFTGKALSLRLVRSTEQSLHEMFCCSPARGG